MIFYLCIAGLPCEVAKEIQGRPAALFTEDGSNPPVIRPISPPYAYRAGMADAYLHEIARRISDLPLTQDATVLLTYVNYPGVGTAAFVEHFFPFALVASVSPIYLDAIPRYERRHEMRRWIGNIEKVSTRLRRHARVARDVFSGQNMTPLLLPLRNFKSGVLAPQVEALFSKLGSTNDPRKELSCARIVLEAAHPLRKIKYEEKGKSTERRQDNNKPYFEDDRALRFKSPGSDRHGMARTFQAPHTPSCFINGRVRLGAPYDGLFHYDCDHELRKIESLYPNCHNAETRPAAQTHVNIAPNDAIR